MNPAGNDGSRKGVEERERAMKSRFPLEAPIQRTSRARINLFTSRLSAVKLHISGC